MSDKYGAESLMALRAFATLRLKLAKSSDPSVEDSQNFLADLFQYIDTRIAGMKAREEPSVVRWEKARELLDLFDTDNQESYTRIRELVTAVVHGWNNLHHAFKDANGGNVSALNEEIARLNEALTTVSEQVNDLTQQNEALTQNVEDLSSKRGFVYTIPLPSASFLAAVTEANDTFITQSKQEDIETRIEWFMHPDEHCVGVGVFLNHNVKPWIFPFYEAISEYETQNHLAFDYDNAEHVSAVFHNVLGAAIALADALCLTYGPLFSVPVASRSKLARDESERFADDAGMQTAPIGGTSEPIEAPETSGTEALDDNAAITEDADIPLDDSSDDIPPEDEGSDPHDDEPDVGRD